MSPSFLLQNIKLACQYCIKVTGGEKCQFDKFGRLKTEEVSGFEEKPNHNVGDGLLGGAGRRPSRDNQEAQILRQSAPNIFPG